MVQAKCSFRTFFPKLEAESESGVPLPRGRREEATGEALDRWIPEASDTWQWQLQIEEGSVPNTTQEVAIYDIDLFDNDGGSGRIRLEFATLAGPTPHHRAAPTAPG